MLLDVNGNLCEGMGSNVFVVRDREVATPPLVDDVLRRGRFGDAKEVTVRAGSLTIKDDRATGRLRIRWRVPGIGTFAYLASRPMRTNPLLLRVALDGGERLEQLPAFAEQDGHDVNL